MIVVIGRVVVESRELAAARALCLEHVARSRTEPGCVSHAVHQDLEDPARLVFVERWSDREALQRHFEVPASRAFVAELSRLASEAPEISLYEARELPPPGLAGPGAARS